MLDAGGDKNHDSNFFWSVGKGWATENHSYKFNIFFII
jgi:hypothetical protein